jgi:hypothetical protein
MPWTDSSTTLSTNQSVVVNTQDGLHITGYQPFITLSDSHAANAQARVQSADGKFVFYPQSGFSSGIPSVIFNNLVAAAGAALPSAIEIHAQDGLQVVGYQPFITLTDANHGYAKASVQCANGDLVFYTQGGLASHTPPMIIESATGNVHVTGALVADKDIMLTGQDCAERFDVAGDRYLEAGTVVVIDDDGTLRESSTEYDKRVAGVVAGAGDYRPAIVMGARSGATAGAVIALVGKAYCKADASCGAIGVGDLLAASPTPGHAMKASDPSRAFGAVIGKALRPLKSGTGLIPMLIALQ